MCEQEESYEIARTMWVQCSRLTLRSSFTRIECVLVRAGVPVKAQCGHIVYKGKDSVNEEHAKEGSHGAENVNDQN